MALEIIDCTDFDAIRALSPDHTVAEKCDCRRFLRQKSATVAVFCDSLTFLRHCGQGFTDTRTYCLCNYV